MLGGDKLGGVSDGAGSFTVNDKLLSFERRLAMIELYVARLADGVPKSKASRINSEN